MLLGSELWAILKCAARPRSLEASGSLRLGLRALGVHAPLPAAAWPAVRIFVTVSAEKLDAVGVSPAEGAGNHMVTVKRLALHSASLARSTGHSPILA